VCNGSVFEQDDTDDEKEEEEEKEDTKADEPWLAAQPLSLLTRFTHFHLGVGWASPASLTLL